MLVINAQSPVFSLVIRWVALVQEGRRWARDQGVTGSAGRLKGIQSTLVA